VSTPLRESSRGWIGTLLADDRVRYLLVGGCTSALYYGLFALGWLALGTHLPYLVVTVLAHVITAVLVYPLYRTFVFRSTAHWLRGFVRFYVVFASGLVVSFVGLPLLVEVAGVPVLLAQALLIVLLPVLSYLAHRFWTFRPKHAEGDQPGRGASDRPPERA
jgi:putative flippase GtrA